MVPIFALLAIFGLGISNAAVDKDEITDLPGLSFTPNFKSYSGFLKASGTRKLHYWFVTSQNEPSSDPVVLWLNGGPGCSSLDGLLSEHGPYLVNSDGKTLRKNPYSWNMIANVIYMEAPAGVGYSYSDDKNYTTGDDQVAADNHLALTTFFSKYPEFSKNEFYITGESYGGIYVPTLSAKVLDDKSINFMGMAIGNGALDFAKLDNSMIPFGFSHGLWGETLMDNMRERCCTNCTNCNYHQNTDPQCNKYVGEAMQIISSLNIYNLYADCYTQKSLDKNKTHIMYADQHLFRKNPEVIAKEQNVLQTVRADNIQLVPPCIDVKGLTNYLNDAAVREAIHIPQSLPQWEICSGIVGALYKREYNEMKSQVMSVLQAKKRVLVYNGDIDMACNFLGDEWFVDSLSQPMKSSRKEWMFTAKDGSSQIAGFVKQFLNITYMTIKGSGHMVPQDKPIPAFVMFTHFIKNQPY